MGECFSAWLCLFLESSIDTPSREPSCTMTNRIRESRSCRSVGAEGSNVLGYSEVRTFGVDGAGFINPQFTRLIRSRQHPPILTCVSESVEKRAECVRELKLNSIWQLTPFSAARVANMLTMDLSQAVHQTGRGGRR